MTHLIRGGLLLAAATALFLVLRALILQGVLTADTFGLFPPDREENTALWANQPQVFAESTSCAKCHSDIYQTWRPSSHGTVACETCHGPSLDHVEDTEVSVSIDKSRDLCELCHGELAARPVRFPQIAPDHYAAACTSCHQPHYPGPASTITHQATGDCLQCHGVVAPEAKPIPGDHAGRTSDQCLDCHESE